MTSLYKIKPLVWDGEITEKNEDITAAMSIAEYTISTSSGAVWLDIDSFADLDIPSHTACSSVEDAKAKAEADWLERADKVVRTIIEVTTVDPFDLMGIAFDAIANLRCPVADKKV
jgi:hypothetical protein